MCSFSLAIALNVLRFTSSDYPLWYLQTFLMSALYHLQQIIYMEHGVVLDKNKKNKKQTS